MSNLVSSIPLTVRERRQTIPLRVSPGSSGGGGTRDYNQLANKPTINGVTVEGAKTGNDYGLAEFPNEGFAGDLLTKTSNGTAWVTPASSAEQDNTRPITSAAVYTEIGNINALLATI